MAWLGIAKRIESRCHMRSLSLRTATPRFPSGAFVLAIVARGDIRKPQRPAHPRLAARTRLVENVVVPLVGGLAHESHLLQEVRLDGRPGQDGHAAAAAAGAPRAIVRGELEVDFDELAETRAVVVAHSPRVAKGLEDRIGLQDLPLDGLAASSS